MPVWSVAVHCPVTLSRVANQCRDMMTVSRSDRCVILSTSVTRYLGLAQPETIDDSTAQKTIDVSTAQKTIPICLEGKTLGKHRRLTLRSFRRKLFAKVTSGLRWPRIVSNCGFSLNLCVLLPENLLSGRRILGNHYVSIGDVRN
jgi:hypothetical protein